MPQYYGGFAGSGRAIAIGDLNGNGNPDIAVAVEQAFAFVATGDGEGNFQVQPSIDAGSTFQGSRHIEIGDVNGDGHLDLITGNPVENTVSVIINTGDGPPTFHPQHRTSIGSNTRLVKVSDLTGNGFPDLVANSTSNDLSVLLGLSRTP